jgi:branched-chain amino acid transport system ATP-binding protein
MLDIQGVSRSFGGVFAVNNVSMTVEEGQVHAVIGPNGAGKSTLFNLITGHLRLDAGHISYRGSPIEHLSAHRRAHDGIAIVFQGARVFRGMTVMENVMVGAHSWTSHGFWAAALRLPRLRREEAEIRGAARAALDRVGLAGDADVPVESLPFGHQRRLQLARALCARPALLLLDEPASGLRSGERELLAALIEELRGGDLTMMLIEHDVAFVSRLADRMTVLDLGEVIAEGTVAEVTRDPRVVAAYLGEEAHSGSA